MARDLMYVRALLRFAVCRIAFCARLSELAICPSSLTDSCVQAWAVAQGKERAKAEDDQSESHQCIYPTSKWLLSLSCGTQQRYDRACVVFFSTIYETSHFLCPKLLQRQ